MTTTIKTILTALCITICSSTIWAKQQQTTQQQSQQTSEEIKTIFNTKLPEFSTKNKTIESKFTHTKHLQKLTQEVEMQGEFYYNNTGSMALLYTKPQGDKIIIKDGTFTIVTAGKATTADGKTNPMLAQIVQMMKACMTGDVSQLGRGWSTTYSLKNNQYHIEMAPQDKRTKKYLSNITLVFNTTDLTLEELTMYETTGNYPKYKFTNKVFNKAINPTKFEL